MAALKTSMPKLKILISGAGIAGPCLAYWLSRTRLNTSITIVERSPSPRISGQALDIHDSAIEVVKKMGLLDAVRSYSTTEEGTRFVNASGKAIAEFMAPSLTAEYEILRADLSELFLKATERMSNIRYIYGQSVESLEQTDAKVNVTFSSGSKDSFDLFVAADGAASKTRSMILNEETVKNCSQFLGMYNAFFSIPRIPSDERLWQIYNIPQGRGIMIRPHRNNTTMGAYMTIATAARGVCDQDLDDALRDGIDAKKRVLHERFNDAGWEAKRVLDGMDQAEDFYMSSATKVTLSKWTNKRAVLLGDAAWASFGATSLAIEGAYSLAGEIGKIKGTKDVPRALEKYEEVFRPIYVEKGDLPPGFPQIMFPQSWGLRVRDAFLWTVSRTGLHKLFLAYSETKTVFKLPEYDWRI
ncbi:flavo protein monooxygenase [Venturia nashicola]|nr:flavo protein monooxygenase [Venturia nashicola]